MKLTDRRFPIHYNNGHYNTHGSLKNNVKDTAAIVARMIREGENYFHDTLAPGFIEELLETGTTFLSEDDFEVLREKHLRYLLKEK